MKYKQPLLEGVFLKRYKRFFADVTLAGKTEVAHVANTGSLKSINNPGAACLVSPADNPERKLRFTLEAIKSPAGSWVGVNTSLPNHLVREAFEQGVIPHWKQYETFKAEVKISSETRLDAVLSKGSHLHYVEVKNVTMAAMAEMAEALPVPSGEVMAGKMAKPERGTAPGTPKMCALFPDAVTERGQKHLRELMALVKEGNTAEIFFTVQRSDCSEFRPADHVDPEYGRLLREAAAAGVVISAYVVELSRTEISIRGKSLPVVL